MTRRKVLLGAIKFSALSLSGAILWRVGAKANDRMLLRPPAALDEAKFISSCIRCGLCVQACPFDTLKLARAGDGLGAGLPYFTPRSQPCKMCPDIPCAAICPTKALDLNLIKNKDKKPDIALAKMGVAVVDTLNCVAFWGISCDACYRACPLIDKALKVEHRRNERTGKHALLLPVVDNALCTGCGMCEHACITQKPSITILPQSAVLGKVNDTYVKGWDEQDQKRVNEKNAQSIAPSKSAQDYLNSGDEL